MKYLGIDIETTGLDPTKDRILEIAVLAIDEDFQEVSSFTSAIACPAVLRNARMDDYVRGMHTKNGLLRELDTGAASDIAAVEALLLNFIGEEEPMPLGSSVHFDLGFLAHWMPLFRSRLSHRIVDDRSVKEILGRLPGKEPAHRALADIRATLEVIQEALEVIQEAREVLRITVP